MPLDIAVPGLGQVRSEAPLTQALPKGLPVLDLTRLDLEAPIPTGPDRTGSS